MPILMFALWAPLLVKTCGLRQCHYVGCDIRGHEFLTISLTAF